MIAKEMDENDTGIIGSDYEDEVDTEMAEIVAVHRKLRVEEADPSPISNSPTIGEAVKGSGRIWTECCRVFRRRFLPYLDCLLDHVQSLLSTTHVRQAIGEVVKGSGQI